MLLQSLPSDLITHSAIISACEKGVQPERAFEVFRAMQRQRVVPGAISLETLILAGTALTQ